MALHDITKKIIDDAQSQAADIMRGAVTSVKEITQEAEKINKAHERQSDQETAQIIEARERTALSRARREAQKIIGAKRRELIDSVLAGVVKKISGADESQYREFVGGLLNTVDQAVYQDISEVRVPQSREVLMREVLAQKGIDAKVVADDAITAGMILVSQKADYDMTLERIMTDSAQELEQEIARILFGTK